MTEAGEQWAKKAARQITSEDYEQVHALSLRAAEFWVRAFVSDVEKRTRVLALANSHGIPHDRNFVDISEAFGDLTRELLGPRD